MTDAKPSLRGLVLAPALITLAVTLLRLAGELMGWSPRLFSREAGGAGALVGIVWLIPVFGILFALRLAASGSGPAHLGKALGWALLAFVLNTAAAVAAFRLFPEGPVIQLGLFTATSWVAIFLARRGWPELWRVLLAYGFAARLPVVAIMFFSIFGGWDTHYSKPRPDFPPMGPGGVFFWTALLPQLSIWIYLTVIGGLVFGGLAVAARRLERIGDAGGGAMRRFIVTLALGSLALPAPARDGRRIFVSVDMEGIGGVVTDQQLGVAGFEYQRFRELMTEEANAAVAAARDAGASEFVVADSHGNFQNLLVEKLPADVQVVRGGPRPLSMMQGIDDSFDGVVFIGYHSSTTNPDGVRAHTFSSAYLADVRVNGVSVTEGAWNAALAGHYGVPVLAVSGDEAAVREVQALLPGVEGAVVKWPYGFHSARVLSPEASRSAIKDAVKKAMARRTQIKPHRVQTPLEVEVRFKAYRPSEILAWLPLFKRVDAHAVRYSAKDMPEAVRIMSFLSNYQLDLQP